MGGDELDLDAAAETLYAGSPEEFVARRKELTTAARTAGDRPLARQIELLRRPTRSAWLVNVVSREARAEVQGLLELRGQLADAQARGDGDDLRRLSADRRRSVDRLARQAVRLGADRGYRAPESAVQDITQTLQAALGDPQVGELLRQGRLVQATTYGGFGITSAEAGPATGADHDLDLLAALAASMPTPGQVPVKEVAAVPTESDDGAEALAEAVAERDAQAAQEQQRQEELRREELRREELRREELRREELRREELRREELRREELREAEAEAEEATRRADELAERIEELKHDLRQTEEAERTAEAAARAARRRLSGLRGRR